MKKKPRPMPHRLIPPPVVQLCYHGTTRMKARKILKHGLRKGSYLARNLEDAIGFGGKYVLVFKFPYKIFTHWQYVTERRISPIHITAFRHYNVISLPRK